MEKKFNEALKKRDEAHKEDHSKMQTNFDLQLNKMKSDFDTANATINNKIVLIQNDVSSMDSKLDTGFTHTQSLIAELSQQLNQIVTALVSPKIPSPERTRKKRQQKIDTTFDDDDLNPDETQETHLGDDLSRIESDEENSDDEMLGTQPQHSGAAHHPLDSAYNQHQNTMMNNSMDSDVGAGC